MVEGKIVASSLPGEVGKEAEVPEGDRQNEETPPMGHAPEQPTPPTPFEIIMEALGVINKRLDQQGEAILNLADKVIKTGPSEGGPSGGFGIKDLNDLLSNVKGMLSNEGGGGMDDIYKNIGKTVWDGTLETSMKNLIRSTGKSVAGHVTGHVG